VPPPLRWGLRLAADGWVPGRHKGPIGAMLCLVGYLGLLALALAWRFRSGAWKRIALIEPKLV
jgi:hypothetical protein